MKEKQKIKSQVVINGTAESKNGLPVTLSWHDSSLTRLDYREGDTLAEMTMRGGSESSKKFFRNDPHPVCFTGGGDNKRMTLKQQQVYKMHPQT